MVESSNNSKQMNFPKWLVENLRLTVFTFPEDFSIDRSYWNDLFKQAAENRNVTSKLLRINEYGPFQNAMLSVASDPMRVDWIFSSNPIAQESPWSVIGPLESTLNSFQKLMKEWLSRPPRMKRLAFGAILRLPVDSHEMGSQTLSPYLKSLKLDSTNSRNVLYQINRIRKSNTINLSNFFINRLSRWLVEETLPIQIGIGLGNIQTIKSEKSFYCCRLDLDISTSEVFNDELPQDKIQDLFQELVVLGLEIVKEGDIP